MSTSYRNSLGVSSGSSVSSGSLGSSSGLVLGETYRSRSSASPVVHSHGPHAIHKLPPQNIKRHQKIPKVPRPQRTLEVFKALKQGLRECILSTVNDVGRLSQVNTSASSTIQAKSIDIEKQIKAADRYKKRLEFHLAKIEELEEHYVLHHQLREGVRNMAKAYIAKPYTHQKESLLNVKYGFKECSQVMCILEAQLESMIGTYHCQMKGLVGFARIAPGDQYEVTVRYGQQKWKSRGRIGVQHQQWSNNTIIFKNLISEPFHLKASELRGLGRSTVLGQKSCESRNLMSSHPQLMTVNINTNGSIKLSIVVTWNPLEGVDETLALFDGASKSRLTSLHSPVKSTSHNHRHSLLLNEEVLPPEPIPDYDPAPPAELYSHGGHMPPMLNPLVSLDMRKNSMGRGRPKSIAIMTGSNDHVGRGSADNVRPKSQMFDMRLLAETLQESLVQSHDIQGTGMLTSLEEASASLLSVLEDMRGQYPSLMKLEEQIKALDKLIKGNSVEEETATQDVDVSIENALNAFDFLELEPEEDYAMDRNGHSHTNVEGLEVRNKVASELSAKTVDSGIDSIGNPLQEEDAASVSCSSVPSTPDLPSTGNEQVDVCILWHVNYCDRLLENLGTYGPLKCREIYSVEKLNKQAVIIEKLLKISKTSFQLTDLHSVMKNLTRKEDVQTFWLRCLGAELLFTNPEKLIAELERSFGSSIRERYDLPASKVFRMFVARVLDLQTFDPEVAHPGLVVTLHQLVHFLNECEGTDMEDYLMQLAGQLWVNNRLSSRDTDLVIKTILTFKDGLPAADCLRLVALLLLEDNLEITNMAAKYLSGLSGNSELREKAVAIFVEALEEQSADIRASACVALKYLKATECQDQLIFLAQTDTSYVVRIKAKDAILSFGEDGRKAFEMSQLTTHGFQGVQL